MQKSIRVSSRPSCLLCGAPGQPLYLSQADRMFDAPGTWNIKSCRNKECRLLWPDPFPLRDDLGLAYANYYTHRMPGAEEGVSAARRAYRLLKRSYIATRYGYPPAGAQWWFKAYGLALYLLPMQRRMADEQVRYLPKVPAGRLLDVGCGSGEWLSFMNSLGWEGVGCDFDASAVNCAIARGLDVRAGTLEEQNFPDASFDAVTLNHVLEHLPDPLETLRECHRLLRPGGRLFLATPNAASWSHRVFKEDWRGLEPPRHLYVFSPKSILAALKQADFCDVQILPQVAESVLFDSMRLHSSAGRPVRQGKGHPLLRSTAKLLAAFETLLCAFRPQLSDCFVVLARRRAITRMPSSTPASAEHRS